MIFPSCTEEPTPAEKTYLDTLYYQIRGNEKALSINEQELVRRKEVIRQVWMPHANDTVPDIARRMTDDFRGMLTAYDYYLDRYLVCQSANTLQMEEWEAFRSVTEAGELTRPEFKERYADLSSQVRKTAAEIEVIARPVYDLEPMWLRYKRVYGEK